MNLTDTKSNLIFLNIRSLLFRSLLSLVRLCSQPHLCVILDNLGWAVLRLHPITGLSLVPGIGDILLLLSLDIISTVHTCPVSQWRQALRRPQLRACLAEAGPQPSPAAPSQHAGKIIKSGEEKYKVSGGELSAQVVHRCRKMLGIVGSGKSGPLTII